MSTDPTLPAVHPKDCQMCAGGPFPGPCKDHETDYRYWRDRAHAADRSVADLRRLLESARRAISEFKRHGSLPRGLVGREVRILERSYAGTPGDMRAGVVRYVDERGAWVELDETFLYTNTTMETRMRSMQHFSLGTLYLVPLPEVP
jgi:hypothetical protein